MTDKENITAILECYFPGFKEEIIDSACNRIIQELNNHEIEVGDEVVDGEVFNSGKGIVTFISPILLYVLWYDGSTGKRRPTDVKKTGRHLDQIAEVLEQLKEEE